MQLKNCTSNSQVIARGKGECNFDCYEYKYSLIARKYHTWENFGGGKFWQISASKAFGMEKFGESALS